jgi:tripartite-type tricarboxylate transporter receptor subunit TctC
MRLPPLKAAYAAGCLAGLAFATPAVAADAVESFYAGRTMQLVIGYSAGGGYDSYARLVARHMPDHIPGHPTIVPQNMPGAGSLKSAIYLANVAPHDGSVFGTFSRGIVVQPLFDKRVAGQFDARKLTWLGSVAAEVSVCAFSKASGITSLAAMHNGPILLGGTGAGADTDVYGNVVRTMLGFPMKMVTGYPGGGDVVLAIDRHEVAGRCGWSLSSLLSERKSAYDAGDLVITMQIALKKSAMLPDVPLITDLATDPKQAQALKLIVSRQTTARPFAAPPGVPADRAAALRAAFDATMTDPGFLADARAQQLEVSPVGAAEIEALVRDVYATPPDVVELAAQAMGDAAQ